MRLQYPSDHPTDPDPSLQEWVDTLVANQPVSDLNPLYRTVLISPPFGKGFASFFHAIRHSSTVPADLKELAMCRVAALNGAALEWKMHAPMLKQTGVSEQACETVRTIIAGYDGSDGEGGLNRKQWLVLRYVDAMTKDVKVSDAVFAGAKEAVNGNERTMFELSKFSERKMYLDRTDKCLATTIAGYNAVSRLLVALDVGEHKDVPVGK
jgi:alkylhydroperoxidase family enzyme